MEANQLGRTSVQDPRKQPFSLRECACTCALLIVSDIRGHHIDVTVVCSSCVHVALVEALQQCAKMLAWMLFGKSRCFVESKLNLNFGSPNRIFVRMAWKGTERNGYC